MGSFLSYPLMTAPDCYELPAYEDSDDEDQADLSTQLHKVNVSFCKNIFKQAMRSRTEQAKFDAYRHNWSEVVEELKEKYPQWTSRDFLNLRHQFKVFDSYGLYLLDFDGVNKALDFLQNRSSAEQRREKFESADTHHHNFISFEEFLQLLSNINIGTPVPRAPKTDGDKDPVSLDIISDVEKADPFTEMCYSLF